MQITSRLVNTGMSTTLFYFSYRVMKSLRRLHTFCSIVCDNWWKKPITIGWLSGTIAQCPVQVTVKLQSNALIRLIRAPRATVFSRLGNHCPSHHYGSVIIDYILRADWLLDTERRAFDRLTKLIDIQTLCITKNATAIKTRRCGD